MCGSTLSGLSEVSDSIPMCLKMRSLSLSLSWSSGLLLLHVEEQRQPIPNIIINHYYNNQRADVSRQPSISLRLSTLFFRLHIEKYSYVIHLQFPILNYLIFFIVSYSLAFVIKNICYNRKLGKFQVVSTVNFKLSKHFNCKIKILNSVVYACSLGIKENSSTV